MSHAPNWRIRRYWQQTGGLLIEHYHIPSKKKKNTRTNVVDAIIVQGVENEIWEGGLYDFTGKDIIIIQLEEDRQGMQFLGRAFSVRENLMLCQPRTLRTVAICHKHDEEMYRLCQEFSIEMLVIPEEDL